MSPSLALPDAPDVDSWSRLQLALRVLDSRTERLIDHQQVLQLRFDELNAKIEAHLAQLSRCE